VNVSTNSQKVDVDDFLKHLDNVLEPAGDHSDVQDAPALDERPSPTVSSIDKSREQDVVQSPLRSPTRLPVPPSSPSSPTPPQRQKKRGIMAKVWKRFKKLFMEKFERGDQAPHKISDKLAPERDDEPKAYDELFSKSPKSSISRK
jgi:hypothetical protein